MKKNELKTINKAILGAIILFSGINVFAQNIKEPSSLVEKVSVKGTITEVGERSSNPIHDKELKGFANDLPLLTVMKQITPNGWIVKKNDSEEDKLDVQRRISWEGGKTWLETLTQISNNYSINSLVNWKEKTITISNSTKTVPKKIEQAKIEIIKNENKKKIFELEGSEKDLTVGASEQQAESIPVAPIVVESWEMNPEKSLKENVKAWADKAGYRLVWSGENYAVESRTLTGDFDSEKGPIKQLSVDYGPDSRAQNPLSFQFYQNRTLVVENVMFEQNGNPQFNKKD